MTAIASSKASLTVVKSGLRFASFLFRTRPMVSIRVWFVVHSTKGTLNYFLKRGGIEAQVSRDLLLGILTRRKKIYILNKESQQISKDLIKILRSLQTALPGGQQLQRNIAAIAFLDPENALLWKELSKSSNHFFSLCGRFFFYVLTGNYVQETSENYEVASFISSGISDSTDTFVDPYKSAVERTVPRWIDLEDLYTSLKDSTICVVANSKSLENSRMGEFIDSHDFVIRLNSFIVDPVDLGTRVDCHAMMRTNKVHTEELVETRIVYSGSEKAWRAKASELIEKGSQSKFMRWESVRLQKERPDALLRGYSGIPSTGMLTIRTIVRAGLHKNATLIGFDGFVSESWRLQHVGNPVAKVHDVDWERSWLDLNTHETGNQIRKILLDRSE